MRKRTPTVVLAPDSFKGSLSAVDVAAAMAAGVRAVLGADVRIVQCPLADGGEGTLQTFLSAGNAEPRVIHAHDALRRPRSARYGLSNDGRVAIIEAAEANGLPHVADVPPSPLRADTFGVGEIAVSALEDGVEEVLLCIGGSATTDGGTGMLRALGVRFLDADGHDVEPGGAGLGDIVAIDESQLHPRARSVRWRVATDVDNPLCGENGAAAVFGPQKGATADQVRELDSGLGQLAIALRAAYGADILALRGAGAAGGMSACLSAILAAELVPGSDLVSETVGLRSLCADADLVITGEGAFDAQSLQGKVVQGVVRQTPTECPVVVIAGTVRLSAAEIRAARISAAFSIARGPAELHELLDNTAELLQEATAQVVGLIDSQWSLPAPTQTHARATADSPS
ncbi:glycerate kinase [Rhodococcus sp. NCIMB 12038]|uniref:glycerate kinase family protein n=1 Tax=Rhodococcus sp. NCIMB 12038 TaxID=933800 RepID=UPI000B3C5F83|nr:glycerate kinase [Rhodococcus sp. NCIMB 12038]OUS93322.1 glycerate kinase [Rhodococcus sp. NCIMB 12038]